MGADRTPEERERMYAELASKRYPNDVPWSAWSEDQRECYRSEFDEWLAAFPQLWDSLPPDPADTARKEAEEDGAMVEGFRGDKAVWISGVCRSVTSGDLLNVIDRMTARAAAGYPVLIAPKGEK